MLATGELRTARMTMAQLREAAGQNSPTALPVHLRCRKPVLCGVCITHSLLFFWPPVPQAQLPPSQNIPPLSLLENFLEYTFGLSYMSLSAEAKEPDSGHCPAFSLPALAQPQGGHMTRLSCDRR